MKTLLRVCLIGMFVFVSAQAVKAQSTLVHYWNFNTLVAAFNNPSIPPLNADWSKLDASKAQILYVREPGVSPTYIGYIDNVAGGDSLNLRMGATAGQALRVRNPTDSMELRFLLPTTGYKNIVLKYALQSSSTTSGMLVQAFDYSVDGGTNWKTKSAGMTVNGVNNDTLDVTQAQYQSTTSFGLVTITFGGDKSVENNPKLVFRIKFRGNTATPPTGTAAKGNNRFDDVTLEGDATASVGDNSSNTLSCRLFPNPTHDRVTISTPSLGKKTIAIMDLAGHEVYRVTDTGEAASIGTSGLAAGTYFLRVEDEETGLQNLTKFVKE